MAVLPRKLQTIFASNLASSGNIARPGSTVLGSPVYTTDLDSLQDLTSGVNSPWVNGLQAQVEGTQAQVLEEMNGVLLEITQQLAYLTERGKSEWLATQNYYTDSIAWVGKVPYVSLQDNNLNKNPASQPTWWSPLFASSPSPAFMTAFVIFDGTTGPSCTVLQGFNVTSVTKVSTGIYTINFTNAMTASGGNGIYGFSGSAGSRNGVASIAGDNNSISGSGGTGVNGLKTATQCRIVCWEPATGSGPSPEDSGSICVMFFG